MRPVLLGESALPYRVFRPFEAIVPVTDKGEVLDADAAANRGFDGLHGWMTKAEKVWKDNRSAPISFIQQLDYYGKLVSQFPLAPLRVVYTKSGTNPAACVLRGGLEPVKGYCTRDGCVIHGIICNWCGNSRCGRKSSERSIGVTRIAIRAI